MYARTEVGLIPGPLSPQSIERLQEKMASEPRALVVVQLPGRTLTRTFRRVAELFGWKAGQAEDSAPPPGDFASELRRVRLYALPNGRRYALLEEAAH